MSQKDTVFTLVVAVALVALFVGVILIPEPHSDLPIAAGKGLNEGTYTFYVSEDEGTLVGAFMTNYAMFFAVVTTYPNYTLHTTPPASFCGGSFNLSLPRGTYYIYFPGLGVQVTQTIQVVYPALGPPLPPPEWPNVYTAKMTPC